MKHDEQWLSKNIPEHCETDQGVVIDSLSSTIENKCKRYHEHMSRWIPVSERLPEIGVDVIVFSPTDANKPVIMRLTANGHFEDDYEHAFGVTHWKPIGEPPE